MPEVRVYHNPRCSKSRGCLQILDEHKVDYQVVRYLEQPLDAHELRRLLQKLGPALVRKGEALYKELNLGQASQEELLEALLAHPALMERPVVVRGSQAIIARPPEKVLELWAAGDDQLV